MQNTLIQEKAREEKWRDYAVSRRARLVFHEHDEVELPPGFSNHETWAATLWLNELAQDGAHVHGWIDDLPPANPDEIRRWFHHRWRGARAGVEAPFVKAKLAGIGALWKVKWHEVARHYQRCPWANFIQDTFKFAREAGLPVDRSPETTQRRRDAIAKFIGRDINSCRELSGEEWRRVAVAVQRSELTW
jgi:hypothetical protein